MTRQLVLGNTLTEHTKFMISSDQQFPYHNPKAIELWWKVMKWFKPDQVDYLGDQSDQACFSKYSDGTTSEFFSSIAKKPEESPVPFVKETEVITREFYTQTRKTVPNADIFVALGNHDIRVWDYMDKKAPAWVKEITPDVLWDFNNLGISYIYYNDLPVKRWGNVFAHHGISALKGSGASVESDMMNLGVSLVRGHSHKLGFVPVTYELRNETLVGYEIGHMSDVKNAGMMYTNIHQWQLGFMVGHIYDGEPYFELVHIHEDAERGLSCVVEGKLFTA
jgi:hypothetical protein